MLNDTILINKPINWTSFDVVKKVRLTLKKHFQIKKIKVGHAGTLDPLATGLLIICVGKKTKTISEIQNLNKKYLAVIKLGYITESFDREKAEDSKKDISYISKKDILNLKNDFLGSISQTPPKYSAIKVDGIRSYKKMRNNDKEFVMPKRKVQIYSFIIKKISFPYMTVEIECSKGTYIRSIANDIGINLGCGAYLYDLCRLSIGKYKLVDALTIKQFESKYEFK